MNQAANALRRVKRKAKKTVLRAYESVQPSVSVVVPVYNTAKYLPQCLDSILAQTLQDIEIVCVNDGSTDKSPEILAAYAKRDKRMRIVAQPNGGYGKAMNTGFSKARGKYVAIVESDDFLDANALENLYALAAKHNADIVKANYYRFTAQDEELIENLKGFAYNERFAIEDHPWLLVSTPAIWTALYKRNFIASNGICFNETPGAAYQDTSFVFQAWVCAKRIVLVRDAYLHYRFDNEASSVNQQGKAFAVCGEFDFSEQFLREHGKYQAPYATMLNRSRWGTYNWNLQRIAPDLRPAFAERMAADFARANADGVLDLGLFDDAALQKMEQLLADPQGYAKL